MKPWGRIAFWAIVAVQLVFLIGFIGVREVALRTGTEVVLQTVPVDPRSLLQGDYAILDYEIARLPDWMDGSQRVEPFTSCCKKSGTSGHHRHTPKNAAVSPERCSSRAVSTA